MVYNKNILIVQVAIVVLLHVHAPKVDIDISRSIPFPVPPPRAYAYLYSRVLGECPRGVAGGHDKVPHVRSHVLRKGDSAQWAVGSGKGVRTVSVFRLRRKGPMFPCTKLLAADAARAIALSTKFLLHKLGIVGM